MDAVDDAAEDWTSDRVLMGDGTVIPVRATAHRPTWDSLPALLRADIERAAGASVVSTWSTGTGFIPGFASRLDLSDGSRIFVKAASSADDHLHGWPLSDAYREEARKLALLPGGVGAIPLLWTRSLDLAGQRWVILGFPYVDGHPPRRPWRPEELRLVLDKLSDTAASRSDPPEALRLQPFAGAHAEFPTWLDRVRQRDGDSPWLDGVSDLARESIRRCQGTTVSHLDLRDDNVLIGADGTVWFCDWNEPMLAAGWLDLVCLLTSAHGDGIDADSALTTHPLTRGVSPRSVNAWLANLWLYYTTRMEQPVPHGSPHLRDHQTWYAEATRSWLAMRLTEAGSHQPDRAPDALGASEHSDG